MLPDDAAGVDLLAQEPQLFVGGFGAAVVVAGVDLEATLVLDRRFLDPRVEHLEGHLPGFLVEAVDAVLGDDVAGAGLGREAGLLAAPGAVEVAGRRPEIQFLDEAPLVLAHRDDRPVGQRADVVGPAAPGEPHRRAFPVADDGRVEVAVPVDLCGPEETEVDEAGLHVRHHVVHPGGFHPAVEGPLVADRDGEFGRVGTDSAGFVDHRRVRRVCLLGQHRGEHRHSRADDHRTLVLDQGRSDRRQQFGRRVLEVVVGVRHARSPPSGPPAAGRS